MNKYDNYKKINEKINNFNLMFFGVDLSWIAHIIGGLSIIIPIIAGLSAFIMCIAQNKMNVLQVEQSKFNKWGMLVFSVGLSLYMDYFVSAGVALYWTFSNLFVVLQKYFLNLFLNIKKYVNFEELEKTQNELKKLTNLDKKKKYTKEHIKKSTED